MTRKSDWVQFSCDDEDSCRYVVGATCLGHKVRRVDQYTSGVSYFEYHHLGTSEEHREFMGDGEFVALSHAFNQINVQP